MWQWKTSEKQHGTSLVELMVGIAMSLILLAGVIGVVVRVSVAGSESVQATRLNQQLRGALGLMTKELQRAGYANWRGSHAWEMDANGNSSDSNGDGRTDIGDFYQSAIPSINEFGRVELFAFTSPGVAGTGTPSACSSNCDCILYSYDIDGDGKKNADSFELFGFRWNQGAVEMRTSGSGHGCNSGSWSHVTDANVTITRLTFELVYHDAAGTGKDATVYPIVDGQWTGLANVCVPGAGAVADDKCLWRRKVAITLEGQLADDPGVKVGLNGDVKIKNDYFNTAP